MCVSQVETSKYANTPWPWDDVYMRCLDLKLLLILPTTVGSPSPRILRSKWVFLRDALNQVSFLQSIVNSITLHLTCAVSRVLPGRHSQTA